MLAKPKVIGEWNFEFTDTAFNCKKLRLSAPWPVQRASGAPTCSTPQLSSSRHHRILSRKIPVRLFLPPCLHTTASSRSTSDHTRTNRKFLFRPTFSSRPVQPITRRTKEEPIFPRRNRVSPSNILFSARIQNSQAVSVSQG